MISIASKKQQLMLLLACIQNAVIWNNSVFIKFQVILINERTVFSSKNLFMDTFGLSRNTTDRAFN